MNVNRRDRRDQPDEERDAQARTPRSGGRTAAERGARAGGSRRPVVGAEHPRRANRGAGGGRPYPTEGSAALNEGRMEPAPDGDHELRVWDSTGEPDSAAAVSRSSRARLRTAPPPPVAAPRAPFVALVLTLVVGGMLGILLVNSKVNENAFRLAELNEEQATLDVQEQQLKQRIAEAEVPGNLAARARQLGLVESGSPAFIRMPDGRLYAVPQPGGADPATAGAPGAGG